LQYVGPGKFYCLRTGTCGNGTGFSLSTLVFLCQDYSTDAPYLSLSTYRPVCHEDKQAKFSKKHWSYRNDGVLDRKALRCYKALNLTKPKGTRCSDNVMIVNSAHYRVNPSRIVFKGRVVVLYRRDQARSDRSTVTTRLQFHELFFEV
jgi:hypothetical protein